jgi:hypothetical protein
MRRLTAVLLLLASTGCGPRTTTTGPSGPKGLSPPPPVPAGSSLAYGPLRVEAVDLARSDVGWDRDFVRGTRTVAYDVVLAQDRATCPTTTVEKSWKTDDLGCRGVETFPDGCRVEPTLRARVEVEIVHGIQTAYRCAGDPALFILDGDPRVSLSAAARTCFKNRNKLKPESTWTSMYELTELSISEKPESLRTQFPTLLTRLLKSEGKPFCRDDGAYLDGAAAAPGKQGESSLALVDLLASRAPNDNEATPITGDGFKTEHALWEQCNGKSAKDSLAARERCLLLRQVDKFLREVEDIARADTPKGGGPPSASRPLEIWGLEAGDEVSIDGANINVRSGGAPRLFNGDPDATNAPVLYEAAMGKHEINVRRASCAPRSFTITLGGTKRAIVLEKSDPARCGIPFAPKRAG